MTSLYTSCALALFLVQMLQFAIQQTDATILQMYLPEKCSTSVVSGFNSGIIISQRAERYSPNTLCTLHLSVRSSARAIRITFEHMDLVESKPGLCEDFVEFYSPFTDSAAMSTSSSSSSNSIVNTESTPLVVGGPFCGKSAPADFISNGTSVIVRFTTNQSRERTGFRFRFERIASSHSGGLCSAGAGGCGDVLGSDQHTAAGLLMSRFSVGVFVLFVGGVACWRHVLNTSHSLGYRR